MQNAADAENFKPGADVGAWGMTRCGAAHCDGVVNEDAALRCVVLELAGRLGADRQGEPCAAVSALVLLWLSLLWLSLLWLSLLRAVKATKRRQSGKSIAERITRHKLSGW